MTWEVKKRRRSSRRFDRRGHGVGELLGVDWSGGVSVRTVLECGCADGAAANVFSRGVMIISFARGHCLTT